MKKQNKKFSKRELNLFPFLTMSLEERLKKSKAINLENNHTILIDKDYWIIKPIDKNKKF